MEQIMNLILEGVAVICITFIVSAIIVYTGREKRSPEQQTAHAASMIALFMIFSTLIGFYTFIRYVPLIAAMSLTR